MGSRKGGATRREFFKQGAVAAGVAPAVLSSTSSFGQLGKSDIQVGVIGTGGRGRSELRAIVQMPKVRVAAICDINPAAIEEAMEIVGEHQPKTYTYHPDLLDHKDLDAIFVETPPHLHREQVVDALRTGHHCSSAKPLALTVNELESIEEAVKTTKKILHVDQQLRYRPQFVEALKRIHGGEIGKVGFIRAQRYGTWGGQRRDGDYQARKQWVNRVEQSGDTIVENQVHNIDVINWIMNDHPIRATGMGGQNMVEWEGNELLDNYGLTFEYPGNRYAIFSKISYAVSELSGTFCHAYAEKAGADVSYNNGVTFYWRKKGKQPTVIDAKGVDGGLMNLRSVEAFFTAIREGKEPTANVEVGKNAALTSLLGRKAIYEKRTIEWDELLKEGAPPLPPVSRLV
jgi:predicted dehydrogenase